MDAMIVYAVENACRKQAKAVRKKARFHAQVCVGQSCDMCRPVSPDNYIAERFESESDYWDALL